MLSGGSGRASGLWGDGKVNERRDDTTKPETESRPAPGGYYDDDATGYEVFDPESEEEEAGEEEDA